LGLGLLLPDSVRGRLDGSSDDPNTGPRFMLDCEELDRVGEVDGGGGDGLEHVEEVERRREGMDGAQTMFSPSSTSTSSSSCGAALGCAGGGGARGGGGGGGGGRGGGGSDRGAGDVLRHSWSLSRSTMRSPAPLPSKDLLILRSRGVDVSPAESARGVGRLLVPIRAGTVDLTCDKKKDNTCLVFMRS